MASPPRSAGGEKERDLQVRGAMDSIRNELEYATRQEMEVGHKQFYRRLY